MFAMFQKLGDQEDLMTLKQSYQIRITANKIHSLHLNNKEITLLKLWVLLYVFLDFIYLNLIYKFIMYIEYHLSFYLFLLYQYKNIYIYFQ
jgi:hypothetical protein